MNLVDLKRHKIKCLYTFDLCENRIGMCGIVGFSGEISSAGILKGCLEKLEYRGYDSFGVATYSNGRFFCEKEPHLNTSISTISWPPPLKNLIGNTGIAHCRWATHGSLSKENTHPHIDFSQKICMVHNGIVENHIQLKILLEKKGIQFYSESDSEILLNWISSFIKLDMGELSLKDSIEESLSFIKGKYSIALMFLEYPDTIFATKNGSSLIIGKTEIGSFVSSDVNALLEYNPKIFALEDYQIAIINLKNISIFQKSAKIINKIPWERVLYEPISYEKGNYPFFMLKEIEEQPTILGNIFEDFFEYKDSYLDYTLGILKDKSLDPNTKFLFLGCGSSWHAGLFGKYCFEEISKIKTDVEYASEFRYRTPVIKSDETICFVISQSGETIDSISAMEKIFSLKIPCIGMINHQFSEIARKSKVHIQTNAGKELGVAATKSFSSQILLLYLLSIQIGKVKNTIDSHVYKKFIKEISNITNDVSEILKLRSNIKQHVHQFFAEKNVALYLGRGSSMCIALEGALKLKEVSYVHAHGYPAAEIKHGPIALVEKGMPIVVLVPPNEPEQSKILSNISEVRSRGGSVISIYSRGENENLIESFCDATVRIPRCNSPFYFSILSNIVLQIIAYETALFRGINPDRPRNLAKSVTVE